mmetsp:Transcript_32031/g.63103  ORF Transcript_32031/g.63103 Transcript_32031/m.63103 type:complete len:108 (-) Transcript_32031:8-331(-)
MLSPTGLWRPTQLLRQPMASQWFSVAPNGMPLAALGGCRGLALSARAVSNSQSNSLQAPSASHAVMTSSDSRGQASPRCACIEKYAAATLEIQTDVSMRHKWIEAIA